MKDNFLSKVFGKVREHENKRIKVMTFAYVAHEMVILSFTFLILLCLFEILLSPTEIKMNCVVGETIDEPEQIVVTNHTIASLPPNSECEIDVSGPFILLASWR